MRSLKSATLITSSVMARLFVRSRAGVSGRVASGIIVQCLKLLGHREFFFAHERRTVDDLARNFFHILQTVAHAHQIFLHHLSPRLPKYLRMYFSTEPSASSSPMPDCFAKGVTLMKIPT